jgi:hypothetical protein
MGLSGTVGSDMEKTSGEWDEILGRSLIEKDTLDNSKAS